MASTQRPLELRPYMVRGGCYWLLLVQGGRFPSTSILSNQRSPSSGGVEPLALPQRLGRGAVVLLRHMPAAGAGDEHAPAEGGNVEGTLLAPGGLRHAVWRRGMAEFITHACWPLG